MQEEQKKLERQIASLQNRQRIRSMLGFTLLFILIGFISDLLVKIYLDKEPLMGFLKSYRWGKLLWMGGWWFGFELFGKLFRQKELHKKQAALMQLQHLSA